MRSIKTVKNLKGKTALVRVDFNVPIVRGKVLDDFRIRAALPTVEFLLKKGARIILLTHLGEDGRASLEPVIKRFYAISGISKERVTFFGNLRKFPGEIKNDPAFARKLAQMGDVYVNEAFSVSHRKHASIVALPKYLPSFAGLQFEKEVKNLSRVLGKTRHPFLVILGGAKFSTKMPLIKKFLKSADNVFVGGALADDFLRAEGEEVGKSLTDQENYGIAQIIKNKKLILPVDVVVKNGRQLINKKAAEVQKGETIVDVGGESVTNLAPLIRAARLILWNGPLGIYEHGGAAATEKVLKMVAAARAESILGGGDTVDLISRMKLEKKFSFVSTGGGAMLDFLAKGTLPGIEALK